jgi:hypothetical protein
MQFGNSLIKKTWLRRPKLFMFFRDASARPGCQMIAFLTKNTNLGIFWKTMEWKMLLYILAIYIILRPVGIHILWAGLSDG